MGTPPLDAGPIADTQDTRGIGAQVRPATPADDAHLAGFFAAYHDEFREALGDQDVTGEGRQARGYYADGAVLVAQVGSDVVGCVAYQPWGEGRARMKRMYVLPARRGTGVGRLLAEAIVDAARRDGYRTMVLDTTEAMGAATALYRRLGFEPFEPDYVAPCVGTVYLSKRL